MAANRIPTVSVTVGVKVDERGEMSFYASSASPRSTRVTFKKEPSGN